MFSGGYPISRPVAGSGPTCGAAASIPGVTVRADTDGAEARRFGARTSRHVVLYDSAGGVLFRGGITSLRGHAGDNAGATAIIALLKGERANAAESPVFGCPWFDDGPECGEGQPTCTK